MASVFIYTHRCHRSPLDRIRNLDLSVVARDYSSGYCISGVNLSLPLNQFVIVNSLWVSYKSRRCCLSARVSSYDEVVLGSRWTAAWTGQVSPDSIGLKLVADR